MTIEKDLALRQLQDNTQQLNDVRATMAEYVASADKGDVRMTELAVFLYQFKEAHKQLDEVVTAISTTLERVSKGILPKMMHSADTDMVRVPSIGRSFGILTKYSATMIDKEKAMAWLEETGNGSLIQATVNAGTLASFCRAMIVDEGKEPPADLIKVSTYDTIGINKYTPKPGAGGDD